VSPLAGDSGVSYSWGGSETNRRHEHELRGVYQNGFPSFNSSLQENLAFVHFCAYKPF
jgi:hypothetical protein